jgi:hypothetical protein
MEDQRLAAWRVGNAGSLLTDFARVEKEMHALVSAMRNLRVAKW